MTTDFFVCSVHSCFCTFGPIFVSRRFRTTNVCVSILPEGYAHTNKLLSLISTLSFTVALFPLKKTSKPDTKNTLDRLNSSSSPPILEERVSLIHLWGATPSGAHIPVILFASFNSVGSGNNFIFRSSFRGIPLNIFLNTVAVSVHSTFPSKSPGAKSNPPGGN